MQKSANATEFTNGYYLCRVLRKLGIMHVRKVSSQISLLSSHRLIRDDTFRQKLIFAKKGLHFNKKCHKSGKCRP